MNKALETPSHSYKQSISAELLLLRRKGKGEGTEVGTE